MSSEITWPCSSYVSGCFSPGAGGPVRKARHATTSVVQPSLAVLEPPFACFASASKSAEGPDVLMT